MQHTANQRVVQIVGDGLAGNWVTWRWSGDRPACEVAQVHDLEPVSARLQRALPRDADHLGFDGELADSDGEFQLMRALAEVLLPHKLRQQLIECADEGVRLHVRVAPTPLAAGVPWGLLVLDAHRRLLDIADVSWIAPVLPRDLSDSVRVPRHTAETGAPPLHVIDPIQYQLGQVMRHEDRQAFAEHARGIVHVGTRFGAADLAISLQAGVSRLLFIGHTRSSRLASATGLVLSDVVRGALDPLIAAELFADPSRWPMPHRVAVLACASGVDMADHEPFGLATAMLHNGAEVVHATLWTMPTDHAFRTHGQVFEPVLLSMAKAFDEAQTSDDPVAALCSWQRAQLQRWREAPSLGASPLSWGAALAITAPGRSVAQTAVRSHPRADQAANGTEVVW